VKRNDGTVSPKGPVPRWRWLVWMPTLGLALVVFYGILTPFWMAVRAVAWGAEMRARRRRSEA
jgi:hypothetical protein